MVFEEEPEQAIWDASRHLGFLALRFQVDGIATKQVLSDDRKMSSRIEFFESIEPRIPPRYKNH